MTTGHPAGLIAEHAHRSPDRPALFFQNETYTYSQLDDLVRRLAGGLAQHCGVRAGHVVAVSLYNRPEFVVTCWAAWRLGAALTPLNPALKPEEIAHQLADSGAGVIIAEAEIADRVQTAFDLMAESGTGKRPALVVIGGPERAGMQSYAALQAALPVDPDLPDMEETAFLLYTSGTTGRPKGARLTFGTLAAGTQQLCQALSLTAQDRFLLVTPLFHVGALGLSLLTPLTVGGSVVIQERFVAEAAVEGIRRFRPTCFVAVPTMYIRLLELPDEVTAGTDFSCVRLSICGGAPMPMEVFNRFEQRFPIRLVEAYGLTEALCCTTNPINGRRKIGSAGIALEGSAVRIADSADAPVGPGVVGELLFRGPAVMKGYLNRPEETTAALRGGWLHTGDLAYLDEDGYLFIVGRKQEMIIRGGENVYAKEVENVLYRHPAIWEAAVVGIPDPVFGEEVRAYVSLRPGTALTHPELLAFCRQYLAGFKCPKSMVVVADLPKNGAGKIDKRLIKEWAARE